MQDFSWSPENYKKYVEATEFPMLREYEDTEIEFVKGVENPTEKTFVDVGAGYGRVLVELSKFAKDIIAIEIDENMFIDLKKTLDNQPGIELIIGDANNLIQLVSGFKLTNPVLLCLQNSIGPWVGDYKLALDQMRKVAKSNHGEIILSSFCQESFAEFAIKMYTSAAKLVGEADLKRCDAEKGVFVSQTGYRSKWWTKDEREEMKEILGGKLVREVSEKPYFMFHIKYTQ